VLCLQRPGGARLQLLIQQAAWKIHLHTAEFREAARSRPLPLLALSEEFARMLLCCEGILHRIGDDTGLYLERYYW